MMLWNDELIISIFENKIGEKINVRNIVEDDDWIKYFHGYNEFRIDQQTLECFAWPG